MKITIVVPVYYNEDNLVPLYRDIKEKVLDAIDYEYEIILVNDGSRDRSYEVMQQLAKEDSNIVNISLSRNFGMHSAILCGLSKATGDCAVVKMADLQEPTEMILEMVEAWKQGNNVVLAVREERLGKQSEKIFANLYYGMVRKFILKDMPKRGFDVYLLDRRVIDVLMKLDEKNSALTGQILWSGFRTTEVKYVRQEREIGNSKWTLKKKIRLVTDTLFSFTSLPIVVINIIGVIAFLVGIIWSCTVVGMKIAGKIPIDGFATLMIFQLFSFAITMLTLGILGNYLWRTFDASRNRPPYIIEDESRRES